ncbi:MAG: CcmD family protein [Bacteroidia bacterium]
MFNNFLLQASQNEWLFASDKIYSVLTIILMVFGATIAYLFMTNRKINQLEQKINELKNK